MPPRRRKEEGGPRAIAPVLVPIEKLRPDPKNVRLHPVKNLDAIKASLAEFGQIKPIVVSKPVRGIYTVAAGNGTYDVALDLGWPELSAIVFPGTVEQARRYALADNRTAELAEWDYAALLDQIAAIPSTDALLAAGFTTDDRAVIEAIVAKAVGTPVEFTKYGDDLATEHECPRCGFKFSGGKSRKKKDAET